MSARIRSFRGGDKLLTEEVAAHDEAGGLAKTSECTRGPGLVEYLNRPSGGQNAQRPIVLVRRHARIATEQINAAGSFDILVKMLPQTGERG